VPHGLVVAGEPTPDDLVKVFSIDTLRNRLDGMPAPGLIV
jgi:hypothetical protein